MSTHQTQPLGQCPLCGASNSYTMLACTQCGARLPWAVAHDAARQRQASTTVLPVATPPAAASPTAGGASTHAPDSPVRFIAESLHPLTTVGIALMCLGALAAAYYFFVFDPSVSFSAFGYSGRVNNIGLLSQRQNGIMCGIGAAVVGAILFAAGQSLPAPAVTSSATGTGTSTRPGVAFYVLAGLGLLAIGYGVIYLLLP